MSKTDDLIHGAPSVDDGGAHNLSPDKTNAPEWPEPKPLSGTLAEVPVFDPDWLPDSVRGRVIDVAERFQVPPDYPAAALLGMLGGAIGRRALMRPKQFDEWTVYPNLWGGIIGRSGVMKTPLLNAVLGPLRRRQDLAMAIFESELDEYERLTGDFGARKRVRRAVFAGRDGGDHDQPLDGEIPQPPSCVRYVANDASVEKLHLLLRDNPAGLLYVRDELAGWMAQMDKRVRDRAFFLETWDGNGEFTFDRVGRGTVHARNLCLSVFGGIQPGRLQTYVADAAGGGAGDDGFLQRFQLLVWPDVVREWEEVDRQTNVTAERQVESLLDRILLLSPEDPLRTRFSAEAQERFGEWRRELEQKVRSGTLSPPMESHLAKARSLLPKLALIFHLAESDSPDGEITLKQTERAAAVCAYLEAHARRVYGSVASLPQRLAATLGQKLRSGQLGARFSLRDVYLHGWTGLDTAERARTAVAVLVDAGWVRRVNVEPGPAGGRPTEEFLVNPAVHAHQS
jgi:Protein of unknown function (DUF3987)